MRQGETKRRSQLTFRPFAAIFPSRSNSDKFSESDKEGALTVFRNSIEHKTAPMKTGRRISLQSILLPPFMHPQGQAVATRESHQADMSNHSVAAAASSVPGDGTSVPSRTSTSNSVAGVSIASVAVRSSSVTTRSNPNVSIAKTSRSSPPPSFLLDDDPFANLTPVTVGASAGHRLASSIASTSSGCVIPHSQRPPPIHPELVPVMSPSAMPCSTIPKSRLYEMVEIDEDYEKRFEGETGKDKRTKIMSGEMEVQEKETKRRETKTSFTLMSAPVSPSKFTTDSISSMPPSSYIELSATSSISLPSSPKLPSISSHPPVPPPTTRAFNVGRAQPRPAHQRPAFAGRPSLPSLDTLARMNVVLTKKVRKGHVGAGLPFEPWDTLLSDDDCSISSRPSPFLESIASPTFTNSSSSDFSSILTRTTKPYTPLNIQTNHDPHRDVPTSPSNSLDEMSISMSNSVSSRPSSFISPPPQPLLPSQIVALGSLAEDLKITSISRSSPLPVPLLPKTDEVLNPPLSSASSTSTITDADSQASLATPESNGNPEATFSNAEGTTALDAQGNCTTSHCEKSTQHIQEEQGYSNSDSFGGGDLSNNPLGQFVHYQDHLNLGSLEFYDGQDDPNSVGHQSKRDPMLIREHGFNRESRWSVDTEESNPVHSPTRSSISFAGSYSDFPSNLPGTFGNWNSTPDADSIADMSRDLSLSRSVSSFSLDDLNNHRFRRFRGQTSGAREGTDDSRSSYHSLPRLSHSATLSSSESNSILHSPDLEWTSFGQQQIHPNFGPDPEADWSTDIAESDDQVLSHGVLSGKVETPSQIRTDDVHRQGDQIKSGYALWELESQIDESSLPATPVDSVSTSPFASLPESKHTPSSSIVGPPLIPPPAPDNPLSFSVDMQRPLYASLSLTTQDSNVDENQHQMANEFDTIRGKSSHTGGNFSYKSSPHISGSDSVSNKRINDEGRRQKVMSEQMRRGYGSRPSSDVNDDFEGQIHRHHNRSTELPSTHFSRSVSSARPTIPKEQQFPTSSSLTSTDEDDSSPSSDDNIPLAQRIPSALTAQKTIRRQVKEEREARKTAKERRQRERQMTLRPIGAGIGPTDILREAALSKSGAYLAYTGTPASPVSRPGPQRQRTIARPSAPDSSQAFNPEDLTKKLQTVKMMDESSTMTMQHAPLKLQIPHRNGTIRQPESHSHPPHDHSRSAIEPLLSAPPLLGISPKRGLHRQNSESSRQEVIRTQDQLRTRKRSISVAQGDGERSRRELEDNIPPLPTGVTGPTSVDDRRERGRKALVKQRPDLLASMSTRVSAENERHRERSIHPSVTATSSASFDATTTHKQRIFIHSLQHYHMADIGPTMNTGELIASWEAEGILDGWAGLGGWMIWEVAQDFGMERPMRSYELISEIQASWLKGKTVNHFLLKKTPLSVPLDRSVIPSSPPMHSGWVEWESKRGKWSKRWMHLKEGCIHLSKKEGRDETLLCPLSNFDAYYVTRSHRSPKPFAFTIKSTDNLSFFENTADYMHNFSCSEKDGQVWVEKILVARSYVLHQERNILFNSRNASAAGSCAAPLSRSNTKKTTVKTTVSRPPQPLVNLSTGGVFEPGSLLSKQEK